MKHASLLALSLVVAACGGEIDVSIDVANGRQGGHMTVSHSYDIAIHSARAVYSSSLAIEATLGARGWTLGDIVMSSPLPACRASAFVDGLPSRGIVTGFSTLAGSSPVREVNGRVTFDIVATVRGDGSCDDYEARAVREGGWTAEDLSEGGFRDDATSPTVTVSFDRAGFGLVPAPAPNSGATFVPSS